MPHVSSKMLNHLARNPAAYAHFAASGTLPQSHRPSSPLIDVLRAVGPRWCAAIRGLQVGPALGYTGSRRFATAAQALHWAAPSDEVIGHYPAQSWQIRQFSRTLWLQDLEAASTEFPQRLYERFPRLSRPAAAGVRMPAALDRE